MEYINKFNTAVMTVLSNTDMALSIAAVLQSYFICIDFDSINLRRMLSSCIKYFSNAIHCLILDYSGVLSRFDSTLIITPKGIINSSTVFYRI